MSDQVQHDLHPAIEKSHEVFDTVWKTLPVDQKEAIKELVQAIGQLEDRVGEMLLEAPRFSEPIYEAHTNTHGSLVSPRENGAGVVWEIVARGDTPAEILDRMILVQVYANDRGFIPSDKYVDQRRQERGDSQVSDTVKYGLPPTSPVMTSQPVIQNGQQTMMTQLTKIAAGPLSDRDTTLVYKGMTGKSKHLVNIYLDSGNAALQKLTILGLDPNQPSSLFVKGVTEIPTPGWTCLVGLTEDGKWANKILDITPVK